MRWCPKCDKASTLERKIYCPKCDKYPTLPEGEKDDRLDGEELDDRIKGSQQVPRGKVEEEQGIQGHRNAKHQERREQLRNV